MNVNYNETDHRRWFTLIERLKPSLVKADRHFKAGFIKMALPENRIPPFSEINDRLNMLTGWKYKVAPGKISNADFLIALADKTFYAETNIRSEKELAFCKLPDIFHDVYGHAALLADETFSDFLSTLGLLAVKYKDNPDAIISISNIYWYTAEVGLIYENKDLHYYGGSIISSLSEIETVFNPATVLLPYNVEAVMNTSYDSYNVNDRYFYINDLQELNNSLREISFVLQQKYASALEKNLK